MRKTILLILLVLTIGLLTQMRTNLNIWPFAPVVCAATTAMIVWEVRIMRKKQQKTK